MGRVGARLAELGLTLPGPVEPPPGVVLPFAFVNLRGAPDGTLAGPFGKVGAEVTPEAVRELAAKVALSILGSLRREVGDLDRITGWGRVLGMVNSAPGFTGHPSVINGFSDLILSVFGPGVGRHAHSAVGVAALPFDMAVEIEAEVVIEP